MVDFGPTILIFLQIVWQKKENQIALHWAWAGPKISDSLMIIVEFYYNEMLQQNLGDRCVQGSLLF